MRNEREFWAARPRVKTADSDSLTQQTRRSVCQRLARFLPKFLSLSRIYITEFLSIFAHSFSFAATTTTSPCAMEFVPAPPVHRVLCADCGTPIEPNSANLCIACLRNRYVIGNDLCSDSLRVLRMWPVGETKTPGIRSPVRERLRAGWPTGGARVEC